MHFALLREAGGQDFDVVFGREEAGKFALGSPLTMDHPIPLDLARLVERSNGVFGQSGTGKSVLTRLLLCGVIKSGLASTLVFDMHSEYAWQKEGEGGAQLRGLRDLFGSRVGSTRSTRATPRGSRSTPRCRSASTRSSRATSSCWPTSST